MRQLFLTCCFYIKCFALRPHTYSNLNSGLSEPLTVPYMEINSMGIDVLSHSLISY